MATETLRPNGDNAGWSTGGWADVDEGMPGDDDTTKVTETARNTAMLFDLTASAITDADTVNSVTVEMRARCDLASGDSDIAVQIYIGGVAQGAQVQLGVTSSWASYTGLNDAGWNSDWTAAQLAGMQVEIDTTQGGMPTTDLWEVSAIDVIIDYTPAPLGDDSEPYWISGEQQPLIAKPEVVGY